MTPLDVRELILALRAPEWTPEFKRLHEEIEAAFKAGLTDKTDELMLRCPDGECIVCGSICCPHHEPLHFHHDGCPACYLEEENSEAENIALAVAYEFSGKSQAEEHDE